MRPVAPVSLDRPLAYGPHEVEAAAAAVSGWTSLQPRVALILGSGLGGFADTLEGAAAVPYGEIPGFPVSTVAGHAGRLVLGSCSGVPVVAQQGRFHLYEGYAPSTVAFPLRVMRRLGAATLVVTNAAGGVGRHLEPGDLMLIDDHINLQLRSPLRGRGELVDNDRFVDLGEPYSRRLRAVARAVAAETGTPLREGVYLGNLGPVYETPAEVRMAERLGADAVGMSTVPEVITARHLGMEVLGITCISNLAAGRTPEPLTHEEVIQVTGAVRDRFQALLAALLPRLPGASSDPATS